MMSLVEAILCKKLRENGKSLKHSRNKRPMKRDFTVSDGWQVKCIDRRSTLLKRENFMPCSQKKDEHLNARSE